MVTEGQALKDDSPFLLDVLALMQGYESQVSALVYLLEGIIDARPHIINSALQTSRQKLERVKTPPVIRKQRDGVLSVLEGMYPRGSKPGYFILDKEIINNFKVKPASVLIKGNKKRGLFVSSSPPLNPNIEDEDPTPSDVEGGDYDL